MADKKVRIGVIGIGNMGAAHIRDVAALENTELAAICDIIPERAQVPAEHFNVPAYTDYKDMLANTPLDAVLIATPHYDHTPISIECLGQGIHVLVEKPIAVHVNDALAMIDAYKKAREKNPRIIYAIMFMQRTYGAYKKIKELIVKGELGKIVRTSWIITDWYRTQHYYDSGGWRATWKGEGGGVLLNQCPHNLDLYQWLVGMPARVTGFAAIGKYHNIEVEDEVTAVFQHADGMVGQFITTTAESPGTNRLEIVGEMGKLVLENGVINFYRNEVSMLEFLKTSPYSFNKVPGQEEVVPYEHHGQPGHALLTENFANAILYGEDKYPLIARAPEGLNSLTLSNAIMYSSHTGLPVDLPMDGDGYESWLRELIAGSRFNKVVHQMKVEDLGKSYT